MNNTRKIPLESSIFPQNPYDATGLSDRKITGPIETRISRIKANFGKISQDKPNFAALVGLGAAQKSDTHQKTTAIITRCGFTLCN